MADRDLHELLDGAERVLLPAHAMRWSPRPEPQPDTARVEAERERQRLAEQLRTDARKVSRGWAGVYRYLAERIDAGGGDLT